MPTLNPFTQPADFPLSTVLPVFTGIQPPANRPHPAQHRQMPFRAGICHSERSEESKMPALNPFTQPADSLIDHRHSRENGNPEPQKILPIL